MEQQKKSLKKLIASEAKKFFSLDNKTSNTKGDLVCDAVPDPPRVRDSDHGLLNLENLNQTQIKDKPLVNNVDNKESDPVNESTERNEESQSDDSERRKKNTDGGGSSEKPKNTSVKHITLNHCNDVKITSNRLYNFNIQNQTRKERQDECSSRKMPPYMQSLKTSKFEISEKDMDLVKLHIGRRWRSTANYLGYSIGQIEQHEEMYGKYGPGEIFYQILLDWKQSRTKDATIGCLVEALWRSEEDDCLDKLAAEHLQVRRA
ncbi:hypothetical protein QAD02_011009 [Eretmocerus hayati]|uniref:Uncharacterized protein n=1 Tax=Eretmocerus hayati TaxID=131215 RepID=A0ACC2NWI1_9HYME|nr:hypothetical protein QAD02_011009 [Eretmocerus hayati]